MFISHSVRSFFISTPILLLFSSCGQDNLDPQAIASLSETPPDGEVEKDSHSISNSTLDSVAMIKQSSTAWNSTIRANVRQFLPYFERASDKNVFCPGYQSASRAEKENCWVRLVQAMIRFESSFNPKLTFREPNGDMSVGLLMLSPGECAQAKTFEQLKNPEKNIHCGMNKMARLIWRDGVISGSGRQKGAATYWSVLRKPYRYGKYKLGKHAEIAAITKTYKLAASN